MQNVFYIDVNPIIFKLGPLSVGWYGLMVALAVVVVVAWVAYANRKDRAIEYDYIFTASVIGIISGVVFSKLLHVLDEWNYYIHNPIKIFSGQGLTIWGAVLGAALGVWIYAKIKKHFRFTLFGDMIAPGIILSQAVGRVGCTLNGCCYGIESHSNIAVIYTSPGSFAPNGIPVLPTQVFEIFYDLIIFGLLLLLRGHFRKEGTIFYLYLFLYGAWRLAIDFVRDGTPFLFGLHEAQVIGLVVMIITLPAILVNNGWVKSSPAADADQDELLS
jgi:phosphatidylglycerol---prolipoprotein diacylglyceryl transferase